jgi:thiol:disulfide interchange protein DsbD
MAIFMSLLGGAMAVAWATAPVGHLTVEGVAPLRIQRGKGGEARVELKVREGFHVQANPASKPQLIATKVDLMPAPDVVSDRPIYPEAKPYKVAGLDISVATYSGRFDVKIPLKILPAAALGKREIEGQVRYQACDDKVCFPRTVAKFGVPVEIVP